MQLWRQFFLLERLTIFWCQVETFHKLAIFRYCNTAHGIPLIQTHRFHQICICEKFNLKNSIIIFNVVCDPDAVPLKWKCWIRLFIRCAQFIQIQIQVEHCEYFMVFFFWVGIRKFTRSSLSVETLNLISDFIFYRQMRYIAVCVCIASDDVGNTSIYAIETFLGCRFTPLSTAYDCKL